ncbi:methyltransferase domain-containing protein [Rhodococcus sp. CX]|uniref:class I SAM-dependent methyltransferase n=1 Tax=Rhodococcus sp. CX TaxID=2789880 RepID=UPI0018CF37DB|nr:class I SAM-dependent methyltransferase [Rhodococcus sp. CX]MBH0121473.1 methyltransferase domain-containing protein [Rhodococcus sp. CX]
MTDIDTAPTVESLAQRVLDASLGTIDLISMYIGDRLGWYRSLATDGPATPEELAARTGTDTRYAREWLEQQAATGLLVASDGDPRTYTLLDTAAEVLTDEHSLNYLGPLARMLCGFAVHLPELLDAYRTGGGVSWADLGADARESQAAMNRPWFEKALPSALASVPELHDRLRKPGIEIADIGCGGAWSTIALARAYPQARVTGYDIDPATVALATSNVAEHPDVSDRVTIIEADAQELPEGRFSAAFAFECIHDMPRPVEVLGAMRRALTDDGVVVVMDEAVADEFTAPANEIDRLMYGFSLTCCLPDSMSHPGSVGTGTVMRMSTLRRYALEAGFADVSVLPIENFDLWRFYLLTT